MNPYAAPTAHVDDAPRAPLEGTFIPEGRAVSAGRGWQWLVESWLVFKHQPWMWIGAVIMLVVIGAVVSLIPFLGQLAVTLLYPVIVAGLLFCARRTEGGDRFGLGDVFSGFREHAARLIGLGAFGLLALVIFVAIIVVIAGSAMGMSMMAGKVPPGAVGQNVLLAFLLGFAVSMPFYMALWFASALIIFNDFSVGAALKASFFACLRNLLPFLLYGLALLLIGIGASFSLGLLVALAISFSPFLVAVVAIPIALLGCALIAVILITIYAGYRDIFYEP